MSATTFTRAKETLVRPKGTRPPGIHGPGLFWYAAYLLSIAGLAIDATLASSIIGSVFNLHTAFTNAFLCIIGVVVALGATKAASWYNSRYTLRSVVALVGVATVGLCLAWLRLSEGIVMTPQSTSEFGTAAPNSANHDLPATALMLAIFALSAASVYLTALKIFVPARHELVKFGNQRRAALIRLGVLEGKQSAILQRIDDGAKIATHFEQQRDWAISEANAREAYLKAYARDAIARAVGRPDATPLVRAAHEPSKPATVAGPHHGQ